MKKHGKAATFLRQKSYMLAAFLMVAAVLGMTGVYMAEQNQQKQLAKEEQQEQGVQQDSLTKKEAEETAPVDQVIQPDNGDFLDSPEIISSQTDSVAKSTEANGDPAEQEIPKIQEETGEVKTQETGAEQIALKFDGEELLWPLQGNVIMNYSMDQTIYFATLDQYKYNPALMIQGNVNDKICAVADGKVSHIETNETTGCTVTVDLGDGYSAVYGQLKEVPLQAGDYVEAGGVVGYLSEPTKYFSIEGANLYFQLLLNNENVDPMEFLQ